jgi:sorbitol-specific phosphotransferase system component IIBC
MKVGENGWGTGLQLPVHPNSKIDVVIQFTADLLKLYNV